MKVLYFHQHFSTPKGAAGIRSYAMSQALLARGHQVTMVCGSYGLGATGLTGPYSHGVRRGMVDGIDIIEFHLPYANNLSFIKRARLFFSFALRSIKVALTEKYDVVFATTTPLTAGIPGIFSRWFRGKRFVFEVRDLWPELPKAMGVITNPALLGLMSVLEWVSYRSAHHVIALSPGIAAGVKKRGIPDERVTLVPNGCDLSIFSGNEPAWRPESVQSADLLAVFAGTHGLANGLDAVLDAAIELKRRRRYDIKILLIGDGKLKPALMERAKIAQLDNLIFHDPVNKELLAGLMKSADIGLQILANVPAFYYGTSPNKFFDYIAAGVPVLNNYPGWLADVISENDCGFVVPPSDPVLFANALEMAADDRIKLKEKAHAAKKLAQASFDRDVLATYWVKVLESVV